jgi:hypothetical protein
VGIAAAIIAGVTAIASTVVSAAGASSSAKAAEEEAEKQRRLEEEAAKKNRKLKERELNLSGLDYLAQQRQQAEVMGRSRSFNRDAVAALSQTFGSGAPQSAPPMAPTMPASAPPITPATPPMAPQRSATPPMAPAPMPQGLGTSTIGTQRRPV